MGNYISVQEQCWNEIEKKVKKNELSGVFDIHVNETDHFFVKSRPSNTELKLHVDGKLSQYNMKIEKLYFATVTPSCCCTVMYKGVFLVTKKNVVVSAELDASPSSSQAPPTYKEKNTL
jgi:hypothetical protein